jgi:hypothetical protein
VEGHPSAGMEESVEAKVGRDQGPSMERDSSARLEKGKQIRVACAFIAHDNYFRFSRPDLEARLGAGEERGVERSSSELKSKLHEIEKTLKSQLPSPSRGFSIILTHRKPFSSLKFVFNLAKKVFGLIFNDFTLLAGPSMEEDLEAQVG